MKDNLKIFSIQNKKMINQDTIDVVLGLNGGKKLNKKDVTVNSPYNSDAICALRPTVISAIGQMLTNDIRIGITGDESDYSVCVEVFEYWNDVSDGKPYLLSVVNDTEVKCCRVIQSKDGNKYCEYKAEDDGYAFTVLAYMIYMLFSKKFSQQHHYDFQEKVNSLINKTTGSNAILNDLAFISEVVYREIGLEKQIKLLNGDNPNLLSKKDLKTGKYRVPEKYMVTDVLNSTRFFSGEVIFKNEKNNNFTLKDYTNVELSDHEKKMVPKIPEWYVEPNELKELVELICCSTKTTKPKRNFMFRGPSSTGKTSLARALASKLNKPYVYLTCSADTESYDFLGQPMYDSEGKIRFVESQFISAIKNGWVVEIQEPYIIAKQGVLTALNGLLDDSNGITLSTGEYIERHPDTVVLLTTNVDYVGCRQPNQSVLRRMNGIYDIDMPSEKEIRDRVKAVTKFKNDDLLDRIIKVFFNINEALSSEDCTDGVCTVSELIDWVSTIMITGSITDSALSTIISKSTYDKEMQLSISNLISAKFDEEEYEEE